MIKQMIKYLEFNIKILYQVTLKEINLQQIEIKKFLVEFNIGHKVIIMNNNMAILNIRQFSDKII